MKTKIAWGVAGLVLLATVLVSCGNMLAHTGQGGSSGAGNSSSGEGSRVGSKTLSLVIANYGEHFGNGATNSIVGGPLRTIVGDAYDSTEVTFFLWGESTTGTPLAPEEVTVTPNAGQNNMSGTVSVDLAPGAWNLTLAAVPNAKVGQIGDRTQSTSILDQAALMGEAHVDTMNANTVRFVLRSDGLGASSNVTVTVTAEGAWYDNAKWDADAGIYDILTGNLIANATKKDISTDLTKLVNSAPYAVADIAPGKYIFKVDFTEAGQDPVIASWSDTIIVYAAKDLIETVTIPNILGLPPEKPTDFKVGWEKAKAEEVPNFYQVTFQWSRGVSKNETGFELELMNIGAEQAPATGSATDMETRWTALAATHTDKIIPYDSSIYGKVDKWSSGSLGYGSEEIVLLLPLDTRYLARIRAKNYSGESDYTYVDLTQTIAATEQFSNVINMFKVRYELNGGSWTGGPNAPNLTDDYTEYFSEDTTQAVTIKKPDGTDGTLQKVGNPWAAWKTSAGTRYPFDGLGNLEEYTEEKSLILTALYGGGASGVYDYEIYDDSTYDIVQAWLSVEATKTGAGAFDVDPALDFGKGTVGVKRTAGGSDYKVVFKLNLNTTPGWNYDLVSLKVDGFGSNHFNVTKNAVDAGQENTFEVDVSNWPAGIYQCLLTGQMGRTIVSKPITLTIADN